MLGYVPIVRQHFEKVILLIIVVSVLPAVSEYLKHRRGARKPPEQNAAEPGV